MVKVEDAIVAKLDSHGHRFEILVDPDATDRIKAGTIDIDKDLALDQVFKDARRGEKAGEETLKEVFGTTDISQVAIEIVKHGEIHLTTEQRREMLEKKRKQIVEMIAREAINPQMNAPHPPARILQAMEESKVHIDPFKSASDQLQTVLKAIKPLIPIRMERIKIAVKLVGDAYGRVYGELARSGYIVKEEWDHSGAWIGMLEIPAGMRGDILDLISRKGKEGAEVRLLK
ncbi:MAG: ribosome assembly factor SBDS [Candidatus Thermoplasmatota archaeon]|nr:ribosome assembly factor SBDS [Candidatus Thermoplasmatota archaeon]